MDEPVTPVRSERRRDQADQVERAIGLAAVELAVEPLNEVAERNLRAALEGKARVSQPRPVRRPLRVVVDDFQEGRDVPHLPVFGPYRPSDGGEQS